MGPDTRTNGQATDRLTEQSREGLEAPTGKRNRRSAAERAGARPSGPYAEQVRLCLNAPMHVVKRLEAHAVAMGKSRDVFVTEILDKYMRANYSKRDEYLLNAYGVAEQPSGEQQNGTPQEE